MQAMEFTHPITDEAQPQLAKKVLQHCLSSGVLMLGAGTLDNVIRLLMPLVMTDSELDEALDVVEKALNKVAKESGFTEMIAR